jgi:hypothetical protein
MANTSVIKKFGARSLLIIVPLLGLLLFVCWILQATISMIYTYGLIFLILFVAV